MNNVQIPEVTGTVRASALIKIAEAARREGRSCLVSVSVEDGKPTVRIGDGGYDRNTVSVDFGPVAG